MTLVVRGGTVVTPRRVDAADVVIGDDGRVAAVVAAGTAEGDMAVDAGGLLVMPGMIDAHVHFDEPGRADWEGFDTGSAAAAAGGVTTVVDMPIDCDPPTITAAAVRAKVEAAVARSRVDVAIWGGLVPGSVGALGEIADAGVVGFKAFACPSGWDEFPPADEETLRAGMAHAARLDLPVAVHCELAHLGHTVQSEVEAVRWAAGIAQSTGARLHVVHVSSAAGVDEARRWSGVTVETCPHYLVLTAGEGGALGHCFPPVRDGRNRDDLWARVVDGAVDCVASDHSPCPPDRKEGPRPWAGIDGVGMAVPLLLSSGRLSVSDVARLTTAAARILRLPGKGEIAPGYDADLVLIDPAAPWTVTSAALWSRHGLSPYVGRKIETSIVTTLVRGRAVFSAGVGPGAAGGGAVIRPS